MDYDAVRGNIAVGLGSVKSGMIVLVNDTTFQVVHEMKDSKSDVCILKYSHNNYILAAAFSNGMILLYSIHDNYTIISRFIHHSTRILEIDFSTNVEWMRSLSDRNGILISAVEDGSYVHPFALEVENIHWESDDCHNRFILSKESNSTSKYGRISSICCKRGKSETHATIYGTEGGSIGWSINGSRNEHENINNQQVKAHAAAVTSIAMIDGESGSSYASIGYDGTIVLWKICERFRL